MIKIAALTVLLLVSTAHAQPLISGRAQVVDGDTLRVTGVRIRIFGIDAPEMSQDCRDSQGRNYHCGVTAARALTGFIARAEVQCAPIERDRYGRVVATCSANGLDLADAMVRGGFAVDFARYSQGRYAGAEREAQGARRGLWAGKFVLPWEYRRP